MKITSIHFDDAGKPKNIKARITSAEAKFIHTALGNMNSIQMAAVLPDGDHIGSEIYDSLDRIIAAIEDDE
jgi:hypothetical protein